MSLKTRLEQLVKRLEARGAQAAALCPECDEPFSWFPIAFGDFPLCGTCGNLLIPPDLAERMSGTGLAERSELDVRLAEGSPDGAPR